MQLIRAMDVQAMESLQSYIFAVIGNKYGMKSRRQVQMITALHYAQENGMKYEETSAKTVEGVVS